MRGIKVGKIAAEVATLVLFIAFLFPFFLVLINSAKTAFEVTQYPLALPDDWGNIIKNTKAIWTSDNIRYPASLYSSFVITAVSLLLLNLFSSQAGWALVRTKTKTANVIFFIFVAAMVIPFQIVMFPLLSWLRNITVFSGVRLLRTYTGMILCYIGFGVSLSVFMFHGFIKSIPLELEEAATIDGCRRHEIFYKIIFPILAPIHATVMVLNGIWIWNDYLLPLLVLGKGNAIQT